MAISSGGTVFRRTSGGAKLSLAAILGFAALTLAGCGDLAETKDAARAAAGSVANDALASLDYDQVLGQLPPEARTVVTAYVGDLSGAATAHREEFGRLPASFADINSIADARESAINLIADGLGEQIPFASRATLEQAATSLLGTAENQVLDRMRTPDATNP